MTKSGLIEEVAKRTPHISKKDTEVVVNTIFDAMIEALRGGDRIEIRGFGSFQVRDIKSSLGQDVGKHHGRTTCMRNNGEVLSFQGSIEHYRGHCCKVLPPITPYNSGLLEQSSNRHIRTCKRTGM